MAKLHRHGKGPIDLDTLRTKTAIDAIWLMLEPESALNIVQNCSVEAVQELGETLVSLGNALSASAPPSLRLDFQRSERSERGVASSVYVMGREVHRSAKYDLLGAICHAVRSVAEQAAAIDPSESARISVLCEWSTALRAMADGLDSTANATIAAIELRDKKTNENADSHHGENEDR
jgi:uncharacterized protein YoaH (UPF0181 family)